MIRGLYTANRSMNVLQKQMENNAANISNVKTPGYKFQKIVDSTLEPANMINHLDGREVNSRQELGEFVFGNQIDGIYRNFNQGPLFETRKTTDLAIQGDGFFTVRLDDGQLGYTKNGNFRVAEDYRLVTLEGYPVQARDGAGQIQDIYVDNDGLEVGISGRIGSTDLQMNIVDFTSYDGLESIGRTIFTGGQGAYNVEALNLMQGYLEGSNVNMADEMVDLIQLTRNFEANQKALHTADEALSKAVNEIGRV